SRTLFEKFKLKDEGGAYIVKFNDAGSVGAISSPLNIISASGNSELEFSLENSVVQSDNEINQYERLNIQNFMEPICDEDFVIPSSGENLSFDHSLSYIDPYEQNLLITYESSTFTRAYINPPFTVSPNMLQEGFKRKISWPVIYCNQGNSTEGTMTSVWIALELKNGDNRTKLVGAKDE